MSTTSEGGGEELARWVSTRLDEQGISVEDDAHQTLATVMTRGAARWAADAVVRKADIAERSPELGLHVNDLIDRLTAAAYNEGTRVIAESDLLRLMRRVCPIYPWCFGKDDGETAGMPS